MKSLVLLLLTLLLTSLPSQAQTVKSPATVKLGFDHVDKAITDRYELCEDPSETNCVSIPVGNVNGTGPTYNFDQTLTPGSPRKVKLRACNVISCSGFTNVVMLPNVVDRGPNNPTTLTIQIIVVP